MHGLVGCCYVPCDDDDESQGFVPVAGRCTFSWSPGAALFTYLATTTTRAKASFRARCTFSGSGGVKTIAAGVPASLERWVRVGCGDSERIRSRAAQGPFICLDEKIMT
jgi:hypothetical protein